MYRCDFTDGMPLKLHPAGLKLRPFGCLVPAHRLKQLKLPAALREYDKVAVEHAWARHVAEFVCHEQRHGLEFALQL